MLLGMGGSRLETGADASPCLLPLKDSPGGLKVYIKFCL